MSCQFQRSLNAYIARLEANDPMLTSINFGDNKIGAEGAKVLAQALEKNTTLTSIDLSWDYIGADRRESPRTSVRKEYHADVD